MKILISAFVCEPGVGSEPGAAWIWAAAAAARHDVWLLTDPRNEPFVKARLAATPCPSLRPVYVGLPWWTGGPWRTTPGLRSRYVLWQLRLPSRIRELQAEIGFDVAHHLTIGSDWLPAGIASLRDVPLVWGPVGGSAPILARLWWRLGPALLASELARLAVTGPLRTLIGGRIAGRADLVVAQNAFVASRFGRRSDVVVEQNIALAAEDLKTAANTDLTAFGAWGAPMDGANDAGGRRRALFVGRLLPWKGLCLALEALTRPEAADWTLDVIGAGADRRRGEMLVRRWHLGDRVRFEGALPRPAVLRRLAQADALLLPSLHDAAGWTVAEALALGCPVVCLDVTGPGDLVTASGGVKVSPRGDVVGGLAAGLASIDGRCLGSERWNEARAPAVIDGWYQRAITNRGALAAVPRSQGWRRPST